jgi:hypothetical protein
MAEVPQADPYSLSSQIERSEQPIARQRQIVEDLIKFKAEGPAQKLLLLMEQTLASLREQKRTRYAPPPKPMPEPVSVSSMALAAQQEPAT